MSDGPGSSKQGKKKRSGAQKRAFQERRRLKEEEKRLRWVEPPKDFKISVPKRDPRPKREAAVVNFDGYLRSKKFPEHEVKAIGEECPGLISVKEDVCPLPIRLASLNYPRQWFLHNDHFGPLRDYLVNRTIQARRLSGPSGPLIQEVLKVDGYALVLAKDDFTVEFIRELIPIMANDGMPVKEPTEAEIKQFNATRNERCDPNILIKYRKQGWQRRHVRQRAAAAKRNRQQGLRREPEPEFLQETHEYQQEQEQEEEWFDPDFNLD